MAGPYYVKSTGDNSDGLTLAKAFTDPSGLSGTMSGGETAYIYAETYTYSADTTLTFPNDPANPVNLIVFSDTNEPPQTESSGALIVSDTNSVDFIINGSYKIKGLGNKTFGSNPANIDLNSGNTAGVYMELEDCTFTLANTLNGDITIGVASTNSRNVLRTKNCTFDFNDDGQIIKLYSTKWESVGDTWANSAGTNPLRILSPFVNSSAHFIGLDASAIQGDLVRGSTATSMAQVIFENCKKHTSASWTDTIASGIGLEVIVRNSDDSDVHYNYEHYDDRGNTTVSVSVYVTASDFTYDGTNPYSLKVTGTNATPARPYFSPWLSVYNSATSAITPYIDFMRDDSATAFKADAVWGEFLVQDNTGFPLAGYTTDRETLNASDQAASSLGAGDWTGESGTNNFQKAQSASVTPAEIGPIMGRIGVSDAITVYLDPGIKGV